LGLEKKIKKREKEKKEKKKATAPPPHLPGKKREKSAFSALTRFVCSDRDL